MMEQHKTRRTLRPKPHWLIQVRLCGPTSIIPGGKTKEVPSNPRKDTWQDILNRLGIENVSSTQWEIEALRRSRNGPVRAGFDEKVASLIMHYGINLGYNRVHRIYLKKKQGVSANIGQASFGTSGRERNTLIIPASSRNRISHEQIQQEFANWLERHYVSLLPRNGPKKVPSYFNVERLIFPNSSTLGSNNCHLPQNVQQIYMYQKPEDTYSLRSRVVRRGGGEKTEPRPRGQLPPIPQLLPMSYNNQQLHAPTIAVFTQRCPI